jgi:GT2 family glycosyltransferase
MEWPKIFVVMRSHNAYDLTRCCLTSLRKCSYRNLHFIVIDDASRDGSGKKIERNFPWVHMIRSNRYIEYCKGLNLGVRHALANEAHFVFVVNNDTDNFSVNYFESLVDAFSTHPDVGLVGSIVYDYDSNRRSAGEPQIRLGVFVDTPTEGYMFSAKVLREVGLLDEQLVRYFEDYDYLIRMRDKGYQSLCVRDVSFDHLGGGTSKKQLFVPNYYRVRNLIWFLKRYRSGESLHWRFVNFRGYMKKHVFIVIGHLKKLRLIKAISVSFCILMGVMVGIIFNWRNKTYD